MTRAVLYILLPLALLLALLLVSQGVIQNFSPYKNVTTLEARVQTLPMARSLRRRASRSSAPTAAGFSTPTRAPYENPSALTNLLEMLAILVIPAGLTYTFGAWSAIPPGMGGARCDGAAVRRAAVHHAAQRATG